MTLLESAKAFRAHHLVQLEWWLLRRVWVLNAALEILQIGRPFVYMALIDRLTRSVSATSIMTFGLLLIGIVIAELVIGLTRDRLSVVASSDVAAHSSARLWGSVLTTASTASIRTGDLVQRIPLATRLHGSFLDLFTTVSITAPLLLLLIGLLAFISWQMALILFLSIPVTSLAGWLISRRLNAAATEVSHLNTVYGAEAVDAVAHGDMHRSFKSEGFAFERLWRPFRAAVGASCKMSLEHSRLTRTINAIQSITQAMLLVLGALFVVAGTVTLGQLVAFDMLAGQLRQKVSVLTNVLGGLVNVRLSATRLHEVTESFPAFDLSQRQRDHVRRLGRPSISRAVIHGLTFQYEHTARPLINNLNIVLERDRPIAVVGHSGVGKSTLGKLLAGLLPAQSVVVMADGTVIDDPGILLRDVAVYVPQQAAVFSGSLEENVLLRSGGSIGETDRAAVAELCVELGLGKLLQPHVIGADIAAAGLSGGERQRVHIARALFQPAEIYVFDEPTAALDTVTAARVADAIHRHTTGKIVVFLTHDSVVANRAAHRFSLGEGGMLDAIIEQ